MLKLEGLHCKVTVQRAGPLFLSKLDGSNTDSNFPWIGTHAELLWRHCGWQREMDAEFPTGRARQGQVDDFAVGPRTVIFFDFR